MFINFIIKVLSACFRSGSTSRDTLQLADLAYLSSPDEDSICPVATFSGALSHRKFSGRDCSW